VVRAFVAAVLVGVSACAAPVFAASCAVTAGETAIEYVSGEIRSESEVLVHTLLSKPGTHAIVTACDPGSSKPRYSSIAEDTIGIKITNGPYKGRYGWVSSGDTHGTSPSMAATP
jgi:hypothetical protein